jgi:hypothetical protein
MPSRPPSSFPNRSPQMIVPSRAWRLPLVKTPQREDDKQRGDHRNHGEGNQLSLPFVEQAPHDGPFVTGPQRLVCSAPWRCHT